MSVADISLERLRKRAEEAGIEDADIASEGELRALLERMEAKALEPVEYEVDPPGQPLPNARRFVQSEFNHPERQLLVHQGGQFYGWDGTCWPDIDDADLRARLYKWFDDKTYTIETKNGPETKPFAPNRYKVADLMDAMRAVSHIPVTTPAPSWLDSQGDRPPAAELVACYNGLVYVPTRTLIRHTPMFYTHHAISFSFDPEAPEPTRWLNFLRALWGDDAESIETLQEMFGYMVSGDTSLQKMFLLVGPRRSGKGTIARILKAVMGAHNVAGPTLAGIGTNFGLSPLIGKPVAIIADARLKQSDTSIVTERLLSISGEDTLTVDRKYKEPWTGQLGARFLVLSNELPRLSDSSGALASRFIVMTMQHSFYGRENPNLTAELTAELPGIFNWALDGLERLQARGRFEQPTSSQEAIRELEDLGSPIGAFIRDECEVGAEHTAHCDALYRAWKAWCEEHGRKHTTNAQTFGRDLRAAVPSIKVVQRRNADGSRYRAYQEVGLSRSGTRDSAMYPQQSGHDRSSHNNGVSRVPPRDTCPKCDDEGCDTCGRYKPAEGDGR